MSIISSAHAGVGGKLNGFIIDEKGEPLVGVNIIVGNTGQGRVSDINGKYYFLNISPGHYDIKYMMIGYKTTIQKDVAIMSDFTTTASITMEQTVISGEEITVHASKPLIQKDATSSIKVIEALILS